MNQSQIKKENKRYDKKIKELDEVLIPVSKNQKEKIISKAKKVVILDKKAVNQCFSSDKKWVSTQIEYEKERYNFVLLCIKYRLPYDKIAELIGVTKGRVYQLYRYGMNGKLCESEKTEIRERENNICLICRQESKDGKKLHIHHVDNPKNKNKNNLVALCSSCHSRVEKINLRAKNKAKIGKVIHRK